MLYANKGLQKTKKYKEYLSLVDSYYKLSLSKEQNQQSYLKRLLVFNKETGEIQQLNHSFEKYYKNYTKSIEQKVYALEQIAKDKKLVPVFITLTLPTKFHPFQSILYNRKRLYTNINKEFSFDTIEEAITEGYQYLNYTYRTFYKRAKNQVNDLLYIKVFEAHKTMIPHLHILFYVDKSKIKIIRKTFDKICAEFGINQSELEMVNDELREKENTNIKVGVTRASKYIMKYITKTLQNGEDYYQARILDGWKRTHKIRMITMSNLDLSLFEFRTIYKNLDEKKKEVLLQQAKKQKVNLFYFILKNMYKLKVLHKNGTLSIKQIGSLDNAIIKLFENITRLEQSGGHRYRIDNFIFFINNKFVFKKEQYETIIQRGTYHEY